MNDMSEKPIGLALLRVPFPPNQISKLPKPTIANEQWKNLPKAKCKECGGYHATSNTIHLDYVGHAALTDRLLDTDPNWSWEPLALGPDGLPLRDKEGGMWIKLTVCGVTRLGYGDSQGKSGPNAVKELIGDALRNAAMRFGAALELWHKGDLHADEDERGTEPEDPGKVIAQQVINAKVTPTSGAKDRVTPEQRATVDLIVGRVKTWFAENSVPDAAAVADEASFDADEWCYFWTCFDSKQRRALKDELEARRTQAKQREPA